MGVKPGVLVAVLIERSLDLAVGLLGVLKAGGAYIPLDPAHPSGRLSYILADAKPAVLLTQSSLQPRLPQCSETVIIDAGLHQAQKLQSDQAVNKISPDDLAYVIYTSGSDGLAKGSGDRASRGREYAFVDAILSGAKRGRHTGRYNNTSVRYSILELFLPLICGARVVIAPRRAVGTGRWRVDREVGRALLQATPATMRMLLDAGSAGNPR